jgi:hypothetical protein
MSITTILATGITIFLEFKLIAASLAGLFVAYLYLGLGSLVNLGGLLYGLYVSLNTLEQHHNKYVKKRNVNMGILVYWVLYILSVMKVDSTMSQRIYGYYFLKFAVMVYSLMNNATNSLDLYDNYLRAFFCRFEKQYIGVLSKQLSDAKLIAKHKRKSSPTTDKELKTVAVNTDTNSDTISISSTQVEVGNEDFVEFVSTEPTEVAEVAEPIEVVEVVEAVEMAEPTEVAEVAEPIEVVEVVEAVEMAETNMPTEPVEYTEATEPTGANEVDEVDEPIKTMVNIIQSSAKNIIDSVITTAKKDDPIEAVVQVAPENQDDIMEDEEIDNMVSTFL